MLVKVMSMVLAVSKAPTLKLLAMTCWCAFKRVFMDVCRQRRNICAAVLTVVIQSIGITALPPPSLTHTLKNPRCNLSVSIIIH